MEELIILEKTKEMLSYGNQALVSFPKSERFSLVVDIKNSMYAIFRLCIVANKKYYKKTTLQDLDIEVEVLRGFLAYAVSPDVKYLSIRKYEIWSKKVNEIGKILGGWIKSQKK